MSQQTFTIAEEIPCTSGKPNCVCVHWKCPFCDGYGAVDAEARDLTPYFSAICEKENRVFLVHRNDSLHGEHSIN